jgi:tRNA dimethylallyltransferase
VPERPPIVAVVGATASGKSELALDLAQALGGEIVNADAMAVYRGMDIGTAKLSESERRGIPHHLLDVWDVRVTATAAAYQQLCRDVLADLAERDVPAIVVGGSGLYLRAALDQIEFPGTDPELRASLEQELDEQGPEVLHRRLAELDPAAATRMQPTNGRRVVRALEVITLTGRSYTASLPDRTYFYPDAVQVGVDIPRAVLDERIEQRVAHMWEAGLVDEVRRLADRGLRDGRTANRALGYQQVLAFLDGAITGQEAFERTVTGTRRFARRQDAWFRKDPRITWVGWDDPGRVAEALAAVRG